MDKAISYKGSRWYKCDLHLHTPASDCFLNKEITAKEWVNKAIERELDCVAVTDHNTHMWIDQIKEAAIGTCLTVFPGVEVACDTSKIHLIIIFDTDKTSEDIKNFLIKVDFNQETIESSVGSTTTSIFDMAEKAIKEGALIIPAHIDEYNGLESMSVENLKRLFSKDDINAVQVVHKEFLDENFTFKENITIKDHLNNYYDNPTPPIDDSMMKKWYNPIKYALAANCSILTFSDNPSEEERSKHGLSGIGKSYTWIKMDDTPSLEGIRQSFLLPELRIKNKFESPMTPYKTPKLWIKSLKVNNSSITCDTNPFIVEFNPQLNTIVGGRGSGKSSILRFIRGVFNRTKELEELNEVLTDHSDFYSHKNQNTGKGVLKDDTTIEIEFVRNDILHKIVASNINNSLNQDIRISRFNNGNCQWENIEDDGYIDFFEFEHYSQKQIFEIAQKPNALRERIDKVIVGMNELKLKKENVNNEFLEISASIRTLDNIIFEKGKIETKVKDISSNIKKLQTSGITDLLTKKEVLIKEKQILNEFIEKIDEKQETLSVVIDNFNINNMDYSIFSEESKSIIEPCSDLAIDSLKQIKESLEGTLQKIIDVKVEFEENINSSQWQTHFNKTNEALEQKKSMLEEDGIDYILSFEKFMEEKTELENRLEEIENKSTKRKELLEKRIELQNLYLDISKEITFLRIEFVKAILKDDKIKINIKPFRNKDDFEIKLRKILQRENNVFQVDVNKLIDMIFNGKVEKTITNFRNLFLKIRNDEDIEEVISSKFINLIKGMDEAQIDAIELLLPEDEIEIEYKATLNSPFKLLTTASPGQKTTAILTLILSYGEVPLILDQPEDDLDNRLVYDLIVDRLAQAKEKRQLIVVTHNANIPVNADAEFIVSMSSDENKLKVLTTGTVDQNDMKKEICDVMEGGEKAFNMRFKRYK